MNYMSFMTINDASKPPTQTANGKASWQNYIHSDANILHGKPVVKGTRLAVDFVLQLLAQGWTAEQVLENYPSLSPEALKAIFGFAIECIQEDRLYQLSSEQKTVP